MRVGNSIYDHDKYVSYIKAWIASRPGRGRGVKAEIARFLNCHPTFVSQVLSGTQVLTPEQSQKLNAFFNHNDRESEYFLNLVLYERAGSTGLKHYYGEKLKNLKEEQKDLSKRLTYEKKLDVALQSQYFSAWHYCAIHLAVAGIKEIQSVQSLSSWLGLSEDTVKSTLDFLESTQLLIKQGFWYERGPVSIHLGKDSPFLPLHHRNWRTRSLLAIEAPQPGNFHYSSVITISTSDAPKVEEIMKKSIEEIRSVVKDSKEESLFSYALEIFKVSR